jgi:hypothetical protein
LAAGAALLAPAVAAQPAPELGRFGACEEVALVEDIDVPEASGAAYFEEGGRGYVLVVSDSGGDGEAGLLDLTTTGWTPLVLPLDELAGDDVEGLAVSPDGARIVGITSSGYLREWRRDGLGFALEAESRPVSRDHAFVCRPADRTNCARNFEGLCLHPAPETLRGDCVGFAASKAEGRLYCLRNVEGRLELAPEHSIGVTGPERLSGCDFSPVPPYELLTVGNAFDFGRVRVVAGYDGPAEDAQVLATELAGPGFPEAIAVVPEGVLLFSDIGVRPSRVRYFRCQNP